MSCFPKLTITLPNVTAVHGALDVSWARRHAIYGSWTALFTLCAYGGDLKTLLEQPIEMRDEAGEVCWCGFVDEAYRCCGDYMAWGWSSQTILNRVAVSYTVGGEARRTAFAQDLSSMASYGQREAVIPYPADTLWPTPELYRDRVLSEFAKPRAVLHDTYACDCDLTYLHATGAWRSLAWQRYEEACGLMQTAPNAGRAHSFGLGYTSDQIGFSSAGYIGSTGRAFSAFPNGETIVIQGAGGSGNNQVTDIVKHVGNGVSYTTTGLSMDPGDDIRDAANGMKRFAVNQMLCLSAPVVLNAGCYFIKKVLADGSRVEVHGGGIQTESVVGQAATLVAGVSIQVEGEVTDEAPGATVTVLGYAQIICQPVCQGCSNTTINQVKIKLRKQGAPADDVRVALCTDCATLLESQIVDGNQVAGAFDWFTVNFTQSAVVAATGCAAVRIERTGAPDVVNYFEVATDSDPTLTYAQISPDGVQWRSAGYAIQLAGIQTLPVSQLAAQMASMWVHAGTVTDRAHINFPVPTYRAGNQSLLYELEQLLALGDPQGRRLKMTIDCAGNVTIDQEPHLSECVLIDCNGYPADALCQLQSGQWLCPPAGLNDVPGVFLQWFELKTSSKTCRVRYVERDFTLDDLGYVLHWSGVA